jgi:type IV secretion system protein VirB1
MDLLTLIATCAPMVAPTTMKAIVLEESRGHPYAIHDGRVHRAIFPVTREEAIATARRLLAEGTRIDAGLAQINSQNWGWLGLTPETVFDPCTNLRAGERVILAGYTAAPYTLDAAISRYNTGDEQRGIDNGYVGRVKGWMPKPQPDRVYEAAGQAPRAIHDEAPVTVQASRAADPEGEGTPEGAALARAQGQEARREEVPAWSFVPVADGFGTGG